MSVICRRKESCILTARLSHMCLTSSRVASLTLLSCHSQPLTSTRLECSLDLLRNNTCTLYFSWIHAMYGDDVSGREFTVPMNGSSKLNISGVNSCTHLSVKIIVYKVKNTFGQLSSDSCYHLPGSCGN